MDEVTNPVPAQPSEGQPTDAPQMPPKKEEPVEGQEAPVSNEEETE